MKADELKFTDEAVVGAAQGAIGAAMNLLNLVPVAGANVQLYTQAELDEIAQDLALVLRAAIRFMPKLDEDTNQLLGAVEKWLP